MRSSTRALSISIFALLLFAACGSHKKSAPPVVAEGGQANAEGGRGGEASGAVEVPPPVRCGSATCQAIELPGSVVAPCCVDPLEGTCGAELGAGLPSAMACQPLTQAGPLDRECPTNTGGLVGGVPIPPLPGCCRAATGTCGYLVSDFGGLLPFSPGCVDAAPFLNGEEPLACGSGAQHGGAAGAGGASGGGASGAPSTEQGGAPGAAGASDVAGEAGAGGHGPVP